MPKLSLQQLLPHQPPMVLLSEFVDADANTAVCRVNIHTDSPFYDSQAQGVPVYVGIEYMAQTVAAYSGAHGQRLGNAPKVGFLLGTRKYQPQVTHFNHGHQLEVRVKKVIEDSSGLSVFTCQIIDLESSQLVVQAKLNVFQPDDAATWLQENV